MDAGSFSREGILTDVANITRRAALQGAGGDLAGLQALRYARPPLILQRALSGVVMRWAQRVVERRRLDSVVSPVGPLSAAQWKFSARSMLPLPE